MKTAPKPRNEAERLVALEQYAAFDTSPEADFDDTTSLTAYICQTPIAPISLVDSERMWFKPKSRAG